VLAGTTNLSLRVMTYPSFHAFVKQSAPWYRNPSLPELRSAILRIRKQFPVECPPVTEEGRFCN
jgi:hypothetical protein